MMRLKVFLGLLAGFSAGTLMGALFASKKSGKDKKSKKEKQREDEIVVKY